LFKGNVFKELVKTLLEDFGYVTAPYGYENQFSTMIKKELIEIDSDSARRIRYSPDLLVYDPNPDKKQIYLVEVKMAANDFITLQKLKEYRKYWDDAIMVVVMDYEDIFYAEKIHDLRENRGFHTPKNDFEKIYKLFPRIIPEQMERYREYAKKLLVATKLNQDEEEKGEV
jgi:hypothetical protein